MRSAGRPLLIAAVCVVIPTLIVAAQSAPADQPTERTDENSRTAHAQLIDKARRGRIDVYFEGDSITRRWGATDYPELLANWRQNFFGWNAADFGWGGDTTQNILWRLQDRELDGVEPKAIVLLAGTNNIGRTPPVGDDQARIDDIVSGIDGIVRLMRMKAPRAVIIITAIFPRDDNTAARSTIDRINARIATFADGSSVRYLNINDRLTDGSGRLLDGVMKDGLHPSIKGYQIWADALKPMLTEILGPPASTDHAPPATGDPSADRVGAP